MWTLVFYFMGSEWDREWFLCIIGCLLRGKHTDLDYKYISLHPPNPSLCSPVLIQTRLLQTFTQTCEAKAWLFICLYNLRQDFHTKLLKLEALCAVKKNNSMIVLKYKQTASNKCNIQNTEKSCVFGYF